MGKPTGVALLPRPDESRYSPDEFVSKSKCSTKPFVRLANVGGASTVRVAVWLLLVLIGFETRTSKLPASVK